MKISRRGFIIGAGVVGGGLAVGWWFMRGSRPLPQTAAGSFQPNAWLQITADGRVIFQLDKVEMGQGVLTTLPAIVAEELDVDPNHIEVEMAPSHPAYTNTALGFQITGGSTSVASTYTLLREAGATARWLLMAAAAQRWNVPMAEITTDDGFVVHEASKKFVGYGELADAAKDIEPPETVALKDPSQFRLLGKSLGRRDCADKSTGRAQFGVDVNLPDMKVAVVARCPHFGGSLAAYDDSSVREQSGVVTVLPIHTGVAIVADTYWQARQAAGHLKVEWAKGLLAGLDSATILENQRAALATDDPIEVSTEGDIEQGFGAASQVVEAEYEAPFLHHSTMEPQNCTVLVQGEHCEIWAPSQSPQFVEMLAHQFGGFKGENIKVNTTLMGGGFGRRGMTDYVGEAVAIARQLPDVPIKLMWSREDDMRHDFYRPSTLHHLKGAVDADGNIMAWQHRLASASIIKGLSNTVVSSYLPSWLPEAMARGIGRLVGGFAEGGDVSMAEGAVIPYAVSNKKIDIALYDPGIPLGFWRSVGHSHNAFVAEGFMNEMAHAAGKDPVEFRLNYLADHPRHKAVLEAAAKAAVWGTPLPGRFQGVAVHESFNSYVAEVVEVSLTSQVPGYKIERVVCAVDCGRVLDPDIVVSQIESAVNYGLSAAIKPPLSIEDGAVKQSNFHDLPVLRINEAPPIEVVLLPSDVEPTGVGEIGLPPLAPALAAALFAATGQRLRKLPLRLA